MKFAKNLRLELNRIISEMEKNPSPFVKDPLKDFTRKRTLTFSKTIKASMLMGGSIINKELLDFFGNYKNCVSSSAFIQQRDKILSEAFKLFMSVLSFFLILMILPFSVLG